MTENYGASGAYRSALSAALVASIRSGELQARKTRLAAEFVAGFGVSNDTIEYGMICRLQNAKRWTPRTLAIQKPTIQPNQPKASESAREHEDSPALSDSLCLAAAVSASRPAENRKTPEVEPGDSGLSAASATVYRLRNWLYKHESSNTLFEEPGLRRKGQLVSISDDCAPPSTGGVTGLPFALSNNSGTNLSFAFAVMVVDFLWTHCIYFGKPETLLPPPTYPLPRLVYVISQPKNRRPETNSRHFVRPGARFKKLGHIEAKSAARR